MLFMLAADLVMSPAGFRGKHYSDSLDLYPGWIPLFRDKTKIPDDAIKHATTERKHLLPCIASFDLSGLSGPVGILSKDGRIRSIASPTARKRKDDIVMLIRAPLPTTLLSSINFRSSEERQAFERAGNEVSNVDLFSRELVVSEWLFDTDTGVGLPTKLLEDKDDRIPAFGHALGGALAMLYHIANRSDLGLAVFRSVTERTRDEDIALTQRDPILAELPRWMNGGEISDQADTRARLFWGVVQSLVSAQSQDRRQTPVEVALEYLEAQLDLLGEMEFAPRLERLISDMRDCLGLGGGTITELFERNKGPLSRPFLLFCLRETCTDLLEFSHPLLNEAEYILAGILFGVRDGWLHFPKELRHPEMSAYVAYRMANAEHGNQGKTFTLKAPPRPTPLREIFASSDGTWGSEKREMALAIAKKCDWNDCIETRITLAESEYPKVFERKGLQVVLPGRVTNVSEQVDMNTFLNHLAQWSLVGVQVRAEVCNILARAQDV